MIKLKQEKLIELPGFNKRVAGLLGLQRKNAKVSESLTIPPEKRFTITGEFIQEMLINKWQKDGQKVFMVAREIDGETERLFYNQYERYEFLHDEKISSQDIKKNKKVINNLFSCSDIRQFGNYRISGNIEGAVTILNGDNEFKNTKIFLQDGEEYLDEVHIPLSFVVDPQIYQSHSNLVTNCIYLNRDYEFFKNTCIDMLATETNDYNFEYLIFVESKDRTELNVAIIDRYINYKKNNDDEIVTLEIDRLVKLLNRIENRVSSVQIYYNPNLIEIGPGKECLTQTKIELIRI